MKPKTVVFSLMVGMILASCSSESPASEETLASATDAVEPSGSPAPTDTFDPTDYEIVTLLPFDANPSIDEPRFYDAQEADREYEQYEIVIGVVVDGEARAYPIDLLSRHEIVNDTIAGHPIAVTW